MFREHAPIAGIVVWRITFAPETGFIVCASTSEIENVFASRLPSGPGRGIDAGTRHAVTKEVRRIAAPRIAAKRAVTAW